VIELTNSALPEPGLTEDEVLTAIDHGVHGVGPTGRYWVLDPIDGTKGFLRGGQYALCLALIENKEIVLGVLGCPNLAQYGDTFYIFFHSLTVLPSVVKRLEASCLPQRVEELSKVSQ